MVPYDFNCSFGEGNCGIRSTGDRIQVFPDVIMKVIATHKRVQKGAVDVGVVVGAAIVQSCRQEQVFCDIHTVSFNRVLLLFSHRAKYILFCR